MAINIDWGLLQQPDIGNAFQQGYDKGKTKSVLRQFAADPNAPGAVNALLEIDPELGMRFGEYQQKRQTYQREEDTRNALMSAYNPTTGDLDPTKVRGAYAQSGDIKGITDFNKSQVDQRKAQVESAVKQLEVTGQLLGSAVDGNSYTMARQRAAAMGLDVSSVPEQYDPEWVRQTMMQTIEAKDKLTIELRKADQEESRRHNRVVEGQGSARIGVAQGALGLARQRESRVASGKGGGAEADNSDLQYLMD
jgi:hypothetical protein